MTFVLCVMFLLSGAAALLFETLWFHQAGLAFGNSVWASSLVLAGFMGGLALGNGLVGRFGHRIRRPVLTYAVLEACIAISGVGLVHLLPQLIPLLTPLLRPLADHPWLLNVVRLGAAFALLLIPSTAMGATLPLLVAALYRRNPAFGRVLGLLYGWNTLGAVFGAVAGQAFLVGWFGIRGSAWVAASANGLALALALLLAPRLDALSAEPRGPGAPLSLRARLLLLAAFLSGAVVLALEVVWFRLLLLKIHGTSIAFSVMLAVVLAGIALGGLSGSAWLGRGRGAIRGLPALALLAGALCVVTYAAHGSVLPSFPGIVSAWAQVPGLALPLMFPVAFVSGVLFTVLGEALHREGVGETRAAGLLTLANTSGAMLGPLVGGFFLLPAVGVERSIEWLAASYGLVAAVLMAAGLRPQGRRGRVGLALCTAAFAGLLVFFPRGSMQEDYLADTLRRFERRENAVPVAVREGLTETAVYLRSDLFGVPIYHRLVTNSFSMSGTMLSARRYMELFVYIPVAIHPEPRSALLISFGVGNTARALVDTRELERIDVVDVSRDILELAPVVHGDANPLDDPRVHVHVEDGRHFLQTTDRRFDVITGEPPPPKAAGIVNLYSQEYFELMRSRLNPGGVASYWIPVHTLMEAEGKAIIRAFCEAFPDCSLWAGSSLDWILVGTRDVEGPVSAARFAAQWQVPEVAEHLRAIGVETPQQLAALFLFGSDDLARLTAGVEPVVDDRPKRLGNRTMGGRTLISTWAPWMEPERSRKSFESSEEVARWIPAEVRDGIGPWFAARRAAHHLFMGVRGDKRTPLERAHDWLETTTLETAPLWALGSSDERQHAARVAWEGGARTPEVLEELGLGALAARDWDAAVERFGQAARAEDAAPRQSTRARRLEIYALCRAGKRDEARQRLASIDAPELARFLRSRVDPACSP